MIMKIYGHNRNSNLWGGDISLREFDTNQPYGHVADKVSSAMRMNEYFKRLCDNRDKMAKLKKDNENNLNDIDTENEED